MEDNLKLMLSNVFRQVSVAPFLLDDAYNGYCIRKCLKTKILIATGIKEISDQDQKL